MRAGWLSNSIIAGLLLAFAGLPGAPATAAADPSLGTPSAGSDAPGNRVTPLPGTVALTFDDGPHPVWTPYILDVLAAYGVKATFFVTTAKVAVYPEITRRIIAEGHSLQNHGHDHPVLTGLSDFRVAWRVTRGAEDIAAVAGVLPTCFRPPFGITSPRVNRIINEHGHQVVMWTHDSGDYAHQSSRILLERSLQWGVGDIVVMHDTNGYLYDEGVLEQMIEGIAARGIGFSSICANPVAGSGSGSALPARRADPTARGPFLVL